MPFLILLLLLIAGKTDAAEPAGRIADEGMAMEWCDRTPLHRIEGIWDFPEDQTRVLVRRSETTPQSYDIVALSSPDCRIEPGETIGHLFPSDGQSTYKLELYSGKKGGLLSDLLKCRAKLSADEAHISVEAPKLKVALRSLSILPKFFRLLRVSVDNPAASSSRGLVRVYPSHLFISEPLYY